MSRPPFRDRILSRLVIDTETGCLLWQGSCTWNGYGKSMTPARKYVRVHRVMYEWFVGPIPEGLTIDHLCRVRHCAAPSHLEAVTPRENVLRGVGHCARNAAKTHCKRGHSLENAYVQPGARGRRCRECKRLWRLGLLTKT